MRKRLLGATTLATLAAALAVAGARGDRWMVSAIAPRGHFDPAAVPPAPDYRDPSAWTAHPGQRDEADAVPEGLAAVDQRSAPVDAFYVHPTTWLGSTWNGPVDDPALNADTDAIATRIQASAFNGCCAVYGPRYRQAQGMAFVRPGADAEAAIEVAYGDVLAAFRSYLERHGRGRPFVLAGHSQGSVLAARLLREEIAGSDLAHRLVAAYLIGAPVAAAPSPGAPACGEPEATGCVVTWNARGPRFRSSALDFPSGGARVCVNPLTWRHDEEPAAAALNAGAVFLDAADAAPRPGFADARCRDGVLVVSEIGEPPRDFRSRILDFVIGPQNYHPIEYQIFYMNLRRNAEQRTAAWLRANAAGR